MKKPMFLLTGKVDLQINRYPVPTYVKGSLVQGSPTTVVIKANVQPVTKSTGTQFLPEEARVKRAVMVWSAEEIKQKIEYGTIQQADRFIWEGEEYEVVRSIHYSMGVLDHWEALALVVDPV
jgi:hypothetical protein